MTKLIGAADLRRMAGLFTATEVAEQLGIKEGTFYDQLYTGRLPRPTTKYGRQRCYYTADEVAELKERMKK